MLRWMKGRSSQLLCEASGALWFVSCYSRTALSASSYLPNITIPASNDGYLVNSNSALLSVRKALNSMLLQLLSFVADGKVECSVKGSLVGLRLVRAHNSNE